MPGKENTKEENPDTEENLNSFKCNCSNNCLKNLNATEIRDNMYVL